MVVNKFSMNHKSYSDSKELCTCVSNNLDERKRSKSVVFVLLLFIHLDILVAVLVALVGYFAYQDAVYNIPLIERDYSKDFSVFCHDISLGPDEDDETFDTEKKDLSVSVNKNGRYVCKYKTKQMKVIIEKVIERTSRQRLAQGLEDKQYLSCGNESFAPKSGHLTFSFSGVSRHQAYIGNGKDLKLHWDKHPEVSYVSPVIPYHNGEIIIPEGRTYYIYASVHFNISRGDNNDRPRQFTLRICRKVYGYEQTLLWKTKLFNVSRRNVMSSFNVASYLQMSRNDSIYVKVSDPNSIIRGSPGNTFGMFPLSA